MKTPLLITTLLTGLVYAQAPAAPQKKTSEVQAVTNNTFSTGWIDQKIEEIKPQRHGLSHTSLASLKSPFIIVIPKPKEVKGGANRGVSSGIQRSSTNAKASLVPLKAKKDMSKEPLTLQMVLNSSALLNGKWLKENDVFRGYTLTQIQTNAVVLERKNKKIKLFIAQKSKNINISTK